jgi:hypothetical protein
LALVDGRHLTSSRDRAVPAAVRYVGRLLEQFRVSTIVCDAPLAETTVSKQVLDAVLELASSRGFHPWVVTRADVVAAYGVPPIPTRGQVREVVHGFWPELARMTSRVRPYAADAAAAALYAECRLALSPPP